MNLYGYKYCLDSFGARYFKKGNQKYYLIGDYLPLRSIVSALIHSGRTNHFVHSWSYNCQLKHQMMKQRGVVIKREGRFIEDAIVEKSIISSNKKKEKCDKQQMKKCTRDIIQFLQDITSAMETVGMPRIPERSQWNSWNIFSPNCLNRTADENTFCNESVSEAIMKDSVQGADVSHYYRSMEKFIT